MIWTIQILAVAAYGKHKGQAVWTTLSTGPGGIGAAQDWASRNPWIGKLGETRILVSEQD